MIALAVDDEKPMLNALIRAVEASSDVASVIGFSSCTAALEWAKENKADVAFLDISMRGMGGLALAENLLTIRPDCKIVFCTGYAQYAVDAFQIHVSGYLMKPITAEAVQKEIDHIKGQTTKEKLLTVKCFGNFEIFYQGKPVQFGRSRAKELFAYLIDLKGASANTAEICAVLWEDSEEAEKNRHYFRNLVAELKRVLQECHAEEVFISRRNFFAIDVERVDCDYYKYLEHDQTAINSYHGKYMDQYSWAEMTAGGLKQK